MVVQTVHVLGGGAAHGRGGELVVRLGQIAEPADHLLGAGQQPDGLGSHLGADPPGHRAGTDGGVGRPAGLCQEQSDLHQPAQRLVFLLGELGGLDPAAASQHGEVQLARGPVQRRVLRAASPSRPLCHPPSRADRPSQQVT